MSSARFSVWLGWCFVLGCSSSAPSPAASPAAGEENGSRAARPARAKPEAEPSAESPVKCDPGCSRLLETARTLLRQAEAIKSESQARVALGERAGETGVKAWRGCDLTVPRGLDLGCPGARELAANMAKGFEIAQRNDRLVFAYLVALDPRYRTEGSESARQAEDQLGRLADQLERAAGQPKAPHGAEGLAMAAYARLAQGDAEKASRDAALLRRSPTRPGGDEASLLAAALGWHYVNQESWDKALGELAAASTPSGQQPPRTQILWHAARGRALAGLGRATPAAQEFEHVLRLWRAAPSQELGKFLGPGAPAPLLGRENVVDAVGAAHFFFGEQPRLAAKKLALPPFTGGRTVQAVNQYVKGAVAGWIAKKQSLLADAETRYRAITEIKPVAPPRWVIGGLAMLGQAYADFARDFQEAQLPPQVERDAALSADFTGALREAEKPLLDRARRHFEHCRKLAEQLGVDDANSATCRAWLAEHP